MSAGDQATSGVDMARITSMNQSSAGGSAGAQMWLGGWIACLDFKPLVNPIGEILPFFGKQMVPGAGAVKFLPCMPSGILAKIFGEIFSQGFTIEDLAGLSQEEIQALMQNRSGGLEEGLDGSHMKSLLGNMPTQMAEIARMTMVDDVGRG